MGVELIGPSAPTLLDAETPECEGRNVLRILYAFTSQ